MEFNREVREVLNYYDKNQNICDEKMEAEGIDLQNLEESYDFVLKLYINEEGCKSDEKENGTPMFRAICRLEERYKRRRELNKLRNIMKYIISIKEIEDL